MNSLVWIAVIVFGGAIVVIGNIQYTKARAEEERIQIAENAKQLLIPELERNLAFASEMIQIIDSGNISYRRFETGAWEVASSGNLITGLAPSELEPLAKAYQHIYNATKLQERVLDLVAGPASALSSAPQNRTVVVNNLRNEISEALIAIHQIINSDDDA